MNLRSTAATGRLTTVMFIIWLFSIGLSGCGPVEVSDSTGSNHTDDDSQHIPNGGNGTNDGFVYSGHSPKWLDQNWSPDESHEFYFKDQGSELIPFDWFMALEQANTSDLFRADDHMIALGFITQPQDPNLNNKHGLPIGLVFRDDPTNTDLFKEIKTAAYGESYETQNYPRTSRWLGMTCAACHTADITYEGTVIRVDGAPAMIDHESFLNELTAAMRATCDDAGKFQRFESNLREFMNEDLDGGGDSVDLTTLKAELEAFTDHLEKMVEMNAGTHPYGFARLDAFGAILNEVTVGGVGIEANLRPADAPVSYPYLWYAPQLDFVQWNRSADNALARNVGEVLGVYAHFQLLDTPETNFRSTANFNGLVRLEELLTTLEAPHWPEDILGEIDQDQAKLGAQLFDQNCKMCHAIRDESGEFPRNEHGFIVTKKSTPDVIHTDETMVKNFLERNADPGALRPLIVKQFGEQFQEMEKVPVVMMLKVAVGGMIQRFAETESLTPEHLESLAGNHPPRPANFKFDGYISRPLYGIWATAPYFHNGSVPNLYETLLPDEERSKSFYVGSREFDPERVGFVTTQDPMRGFQFETVDAEGNPIPGNSNAGHSGPLKTQTKGEDGQWRDFTDEERWALVEYMKTLK